MAKKKKYSLALEPKKVTKADLTGKYLLPKHLRGKVRVGDKTGSGTATGVVQTSSGGAPTAVWARTIDVSTHMTETLSFRDRAAIAAMQGFVHRPNCGDYPAAKIAELSFNIADAMDARRRELNAKGK